MFTLFQTPTWFAGFDVVLDSIAFLIALLITTYAFRLYKTCDEDKFFYFGSAFALMSLALFVKLGTYLVIYSPETQYITAITITTLTNASGINLTARNLLYRSAFFIQMAAAMGSLLLLYLLSQKSRDRLAKLYEKTQIGLFTYLIMLIAVIATFEYRIFYLTTLVLSALIVLHYYKNVLRTKSKNARNVMLAFVSLMLAQIAFLFIFVDYNLYFVGELLTIIAFGMIALVYWKVQRTQRCPPKQMTHSSMGGEQ